MSEKEKVFEEEIEETPKKKRSKMVGVRLVETSGMSALVEWNDGSWKRAYIPVEEFDYEKSKVDEGVLKAGIPYGIDWSEANVLPIDLHAIDQELKRNGIWTLDDLARNTKIIQVVVNKLTNATRALIEVAQEQKE